MNYACPRPIAILMAVYNGEKYLRVQADSIIAQTNQDWVLYIRDDASTDSTREIITDYCARYDNIVEVKDELGNLGCHDNFKQLLNVVEADYYMFSDADDYWMPDKVWVSYDFLRQKEKKYTNIPIVIHTDKSLADGNLNIISKSDWKAGHYNPDWISKYKYIPTHIIGGATAMFNKQLKSHIFETAPFDISYDGWLSFQAARYGKIFAIHQPMLIYRRHGNNVTTQDASHQTIKNWLNRLLHIRSTFKFHNRRASQLETLGYGGRGKYYFYRIVSNIKLLWGKLVIH